MLKKQPPRRAALILAIIAAAAMATLPSHAVHEYPAKPLTLVVNVAAGGASDGVARILGEALSREIKQPVLINNRPGANGLVAVRTVQAAPSDGYTFLFGSSGLVIETVMKKSGFDIRKDLVPVARVLQAPQGLFASNKLPANTVRELIDYAGRNPGKLNYGTVGVGSAAHLATLRLLLATDRDMVHVPYPGGTAPILTALMTGDVDININEMGSMKPFVDDRKVKLLATLGSEQSPIYPDVPSVSEGVPELRSFGAPFFMAIFATPGTPPERVEAMNRAVNKVLAEPTTRGRLAARGYSPKLLGGMDPSKVRAMIAEDLTLVEKTVRDAKIQTGP